MALSKEIQDEIAATLKTAEPSSIENLYRLFKMCDTEEEKDLVVLEMLGGETMPHPVIYLFIRILGRQVSLTAEDAIEALVLGYKAKYK